MRYTRRFEKAEVSSLEKKREAKRLKDQQGCNDGYGFRSLGYEVYNKG